MNFRGSTENIVFSITLGLICVLAIGYTSQTRCVVINEED